MDFFVDHFSTNNLERIEMYAFVEREDGVTNRGVVGQTEVFLRGARGRGWMTMPIGENLQTFASSVSQCSKLILGCEGKMFWGVVDVLHPVVLCDDIAVRAAGAQQHNFLSPCAR